MNVEAFLDELRADPAYAGQIVYVREAPARSARYADTKSPALRNIEELLSRISTPRLYCHQAEALRLASEGKNVLVATGTASGKTLCYALPILEQLRADPTARALLLFPTKALCQDQFKKLASMLDSAGLSDKLAGVFDGDTPAALRRKLRDRASVVFSNPDMLHAALMPQHARWSNFLANLKMLVLDELHVYTGIFGSNMALLMRRLERVCRHYGASPRMIACSATIANPRELAEGLTGREFSLVDDDGSPRGRRFYVLWNPPRIRGGNWRSRRSANVEAHKLMAKLIKKGIPTITFSKAKMTAEMIHRYVCEKLEKDAPNKVSKVTPYRGGYLPEERREIERRLFSGELMGVSATPALELGIDVGTLEASVIVGYPGTRASFFQQAGRAGRKDADSVVFLVGLDTSINQYIMSAPEYIFEHCVEQAVIEPDNPFVVTGHLRCATHEMALPEDEVDTFGPHARLVLNVLNDNLKVKQIDNRWYHAAVEVPQHEISLRGSSDANVLIEDDDSGDVLGQVDRFDAPPLLHPEAIYMHLGDTYRVIKLDLEKNVATVKRVEVDYYTQPLGGTDIHHVDHRLRQKEFGAGQVCWGEVTAYFNTHGFEKIHFYSLDAISTHRLNLPTMALETMAFWIVPPEQLMEKVRLAGLDAHSGLRGVGYATRMLLPLFITCDTLDFSHTVGSVNSPWNAIFVYERYPHGLGFTEKAYELMRDILPAVLDNIRKCPCDKGCPCCVGKPLRQFTTWNVERGEASIPAKAAAMMILEGVLGDMSNLNNEDSNALTDSPFESEQRLERALRRRLEQTREPHVFHPITPQRDLKTGYPDIEKHETLERADVACRAARRGNFDKDMHKKIAKRMALDGLTPLAGKSRRTEISDPLSEVRMQNDPSFRPKGMKTKHSNLRPTDFPGRPEREKIPPVGGGDKLAARARKAKIRKRKG